MSFRFIPAPPPSPRISYKLVVFLFFPQVFKTNFRTSSLLIFMSVNTHSSVKWPRFFFKFFIHPSRLALAFVACRFVRSHFPPPLLVFSDMSPPQPLPPLTMVFSPVTRSYTYFHTGGTVLFTPPPLQLPLRVPFSPGMV